MIPSLPIQKQKALRRDEWTCQDCGDPVGFRDEDDRATAHVHHETPRSTGGTDQLDNLVTLCERCHWRRHRTISVPDDIPDRDVLAERFYQRTSLSRRQAEVVAAKEQGLSHAEIAEELGLSKGVVDKHSTRARSKVLEARALLDELDDVYPDED